MKWLIFIPWSPLHLLSLNYQYDSLYTAFPVCVMWTIFNVSTEFVMTLLLFYFFFWFFDHKVCRILVPQPGIELALPALEGEILTSGPLGKSLHCFLKFVPLTIFYPPFQMALPTLLCYSWVWKRMFTSIILKLVSTSFSPSQISVVRVPQPPINPSKQASLAPCPYVWPTLLNPSLTSLCGAYITQSCPTLCVPWTVARQAPLSMGPARLLCPWGFSRQEYWGGLPCPPPGDLPSPGIELRYPTLQVDSLPAEPAEKPTPRLYSQPKTTHHQTSTELSPPEQS